MNEEQMRNVAADSMAQGFIVESLLAHFLRQYPEEIWSDIAARIKKAGRSTDQLSNVAADDFEAEAVSDVAVKMHEALDGLVDRALLRAKALRPTDSAHTPQSSRTPDEGEGLDPA